MEDERVDVLAEAVLKVQVQTDKASAEQILIYDLYSSSSLFCEYLEDIISGRTLVNDIRNNQQLLQNIKRFKEFRL